VTVGLKEEWNRQEAHLEALDGAEHITWRVFSAFLCKIMDGASIPGSSNGTSEGASLAALAETSGPLHEQLESDLQEHSASTPSEVLLYFSALGHLAMIQYLVETKDYSTEVSLRVKTRCFKLSDTMVSVARRYENRPVRKYVERLQSSKGTGKTAKPSTSPGESPRNLLQIPGNTFSGSGSSPKSSPRKGHKRSRSVSKGGRKGKGEDSEADRRERKDSKSEGARSTKGGDKADEKSGRQLGHIDSMASVDHSYIINISEIKWPEEGKKAIGDPGGTAVVYRGKYVGTDVAVKVLKMGLADRAMDRFSKEISVMSKLHHPNVVLLMGACLDPENLWIVMEMMEGGSCWSRLGGRGQSPLPNLRTRCLWAIDTCKGMSYLHREDNQILHMDLKSANILLDSSGRVKVADFGLAEVKLMQAKPMAIGEEGSGKDAPMVIEGSIPWMAPECFRNESYTEKADIYSFGVILWELLTGQPPWKSMSPWAITFQVGLKGRRLEIPNSAPGTMRKLMEQCFLDEPTARPAFRDMLKDLQRLPVEVTISDSAGSDFWSKYFLGKDTISWSVFFASFLSYLGLINGEEKNAASAWTEDNIEEALALKATLSWEDSTMNDIANGEFATSPAIVTIDQFEKVLRFFGPIDTQDAFLFFRRLSLTVRQRFFHGDVDTPEAIRRLSQHSPGTFLVRFSTRSPGTYTLSFRASATEIGHVRLPGLGAEACDKMISFIQKQSNFKIPCPGSKYQPIFSAYAYNTITSQSSYRYTVDTT